MRKFVSTRCIRRCQFLHKLCHPLRCLPMSHPCERLIVPFFLNRRRDSFSLLILNLFPQHVRAFSARHPSPSPPKEPEQISIRAFFFLKRIHSLAKYFSLVHTHANFCCRSLLRALRQLDETSTKVNSFLMLCVFLSYRMTRHRQYC